MYEVADIHGFRTVYLAFDESNLMPSYDCKTLMLLAYETEEVYACIGLIVFASSRR